VNLHVVCYEPCLYDNDSRPTTIIAMLTIRLSDSVVGPHGARLLCLIFMPWPRLAHTAPLTTASIVNKSHNDRFNAPVI